MQEIVKYQNDLNKIKLPNFTELEQNLLFGMLVKIKNNSECEFSANELRNFVSDKKPTNAELFNYANTLGEKFFKADFTEIRKINKKESVKTTYNLFKEYKIFYLEYEQEKILTRIKIEINEIFAYLVEQLTANFTRFELAEFIALSGKYTKTLYRLLKQYRQTGWAQWDFNEFKRILDIPECYRQIDIDQQILKPALKELTAERNLFDTKRSPFKDLSYTKIKGKGRGRGGNVIAIEFRFKPEKAQKELKSKNTNHPKEPNLKAYCGLYVDIPTTQGRVKGKITNIYNANEKIIMEIIDENFNTTNLPFNDLESLEKCVKSFQI